MEEQLDNILKKLEDMESQINELKDDNKSLSDQVGNVLSDNKKLDQQLKEIRKDNKTLLNRVGSIEKDIQLKDNEIKTLQKKVAVLEERADEHEQYSKRDNIIINGLKIVKPFNRAAGSENATATTEPEDEWNTRDKGIMRTNIVNFARERLSIDIHDSDILDVHTLPPRDREQKGVCIIRFANRLARDRVYQARNVVKDDNIYINEHLTPKNAGLFRKVRMLRREQKVTHAWTKNCIGETIKWNSEACKRR